MPEEDPETVDLVLQYLYKLDYSDSPSGAGKTRDFTADSSTEVPSGDQSPTPSVPISASAGEQSGVADRNFERAVDSIPDVLTELSKDVKSPVSDFCFVHLCPRLRRLVFGVLCMISDF